MTHDDEARPREPSGEERPEGDTPRDAATEREPGRVPPPDPEEAPELLGERSDHPIAWDGDDG